MNHSFHQTVNTAHGWVEIRRCWAIADPLALARLAHYEGWAGLRSLVMVQRERRSTKEQQTETVYYLSSLPADAQHLLEVTRAQFLRLVQQFTCLGRGKSARSPYGAAGLS